MPFLIGASVGLIGLAIIYWSRPLSERYNAWTTGLRERHPKINPPPTQAWRRRNTTIMTWLFRLAGAYLVFLGARVAFNV
jgi:hypothetical protein